MRDIASDKDFTDCCEWPEVLDRQGMKNCNKRAEFLGSRDRKLSRANCSSAHPARYGPVPIGSAEAQGKRRRNRETETSQPNQ